MQHRAAEPLAHITSTACLINKHVLHRQTLLPRSVCRRGGVDSNDAVNVQALISWQVRRLPSNRKGRLPKRGKIPLRRSCGRYWPAKSPEAGQRAATAGLLTTCATGQPAVLVSHARHAKESVLIDGICIRAVGWTSASDSDFIRFKSWQWCNHFVTDASVPCPLTRSVGRERPERGVSPCQKAYLTRETRSPGAFEASIVLHLAVSESRPYELVRSFTGHRHERLPSLILPMG